MQIEHLAGNPCLHPAIEIGGIHFENFIHCREINRDATKGRGEMTFERSAGTVSYDRGLVLVANRYDFLNFGRIAHEGHRIGGCTGVPGLVLAMVFAHRRCCGQPVPQKIADFGHGLRCAVLPIGCTHVRNISRY